MPFFNQPVTHLIFPPPSSSNMVNYVDTFDPEHLFEHICVFLSFWIKAVAVASLVLCSSSSAFVSLQVLHLSHSTLLDFPPLLSVSEMRLSSTQPLHSAASAIVGKLHRLFKNRTASHTAGHFSPGEEGRWPKAHFMWKLSCT